MTKEQLADKLKEIRQVNQYSGKLSGYAVRSIEESRSSYPVSNLIDYCEGTNLQMVMTDMATDESYAVHEIMDIHEVIDMLMKRYGIDSQCVYRKKLDLAATLLIKVCRGVCGECGDSTFTGNDSACYTVCGCKGFDLVIHIGISVCGVRDKL